jgi:hypothetical protein
MQEMLGSPVDLVLAAAPGYLVAHSAAEAVLRLFWVNGQPLRSASLSHRFVSPLLFSSLLSSSLLSPHHLFLFSLPTASKQPSSMVRAMSSCAGSLLA